MNGEIRKSTTIPELFYAAVRQLPRPDMFSSKGPDGEYVNVSSTEMQQRVRHLRLALESLGVGRGDAVALLSENRLEWALVDLATLSLGAVDVPIYPTLLPETIAFILKDCEPKVLFVSTAEQARKIAQLRDQLPFLQDVVSFDHAGVPDVMPLEKLLQIGRHMASRNPPTPAQDIGPAGRDDPCSIIYTSGTTGRPKGVVLSHGNFVANVQTVLDLVPIGPADRALSFLPLSHVLERMAGYYTMLSGGVGIAFAESVETVAQDMALVRPTMMVSVPRLYEKIHARINAAAAEGGPLKRLIFDWAKGVGKRWGAMRRAGERIPLSLRWQYGLADRLVFAKLRARTGSRIRFFISGGAPLSGHIHEFFYAARLLILEGYGLTETSPVLAVNTPTHLRIGSVGQPLPDTEIRIAEDGEILARGPQIMLGYYHRPEATAEVLTPDGWFHTGDIGHLDQDGYLYITDRKKDIIVTAGGKNIPPQPIENELKKNKFIGQLVVLGDRRPYLVCLIVPNFEELEEWARSRHLRWRDHTELLALPEVRDKYQRGIDRVNAKLPSFSTIKRFSLLAREFTLENDELTPTLKVKRRVIQKRYAELIEQLYGGGK